jgi:uncharacterized protein YndB with AHSA1/START domain
MSDGQTRSVVVERESRHPPQKVWRALTQPHLLEAWLMKNDFEPTPGRRFQLTAEWGAIDCEVLAVEPHHKLSYTWAARGVETVVTWTLSPTANGTLLRMEQTGFSADYRPALMGATAGWNRFLTALEEVLARPEEDEGA